MVLYSGNQYNKSDFDILIILGNYALDSFPGTFLMIGKCIFYQNSTYILFFYYFFYWYYEVDMVVSTEQNELYEIGKISHNYNIYSDKKRSNKRYREKQYEVSSFVKNVP